MRVDELMSAPVTTCTEEDSLDTAAKLMQARCCGVIPVVDPNDAIVGMITDRDICMAAQSQGKRLKDISVAQIIDGKVHCVKTSDSVRHAEEVMCERRIRRVPVIDDNGQVVGLLSLNDIAREGQREVSRHAKHRHINSEEVLHTLAAICEPVYRDDRPVL